MSSKSALISEAVRSLRHARLEACISDNPKTHEWKLLKEQFDALVRNEDLRQDSLEQFLENAIRYRCGSFIAWAAETKTKANHGAWPPDLRRANEVPTNT